MKNGQNAENRMNKRLMVMVIIFFAAFAAIIARLFIIWIFDGDKYSKTVLSQAEETLTTLTARRGDILDRNGVQLATSNVTYNLILDPKVILSRPERYLEPTVTQIEESFDIPAQELRDTINERPNSSYVVLKKNLSYGDVEDFIAKKAENTNIVGIWLEENFQRNYSFSTLACSVLGFMGEGRGIYGLEYQYDEKLTGIDGREYTYVNSENILETERIEPQNGYTVMSTIDYNIQTIVESKIKEFMETTESKTVACVVQNPQTGEIYAMADSDNFDCNHPYDLTLHYTQEEIDAMTDAEVTDALSNVWKNFCITQSYEPGSTYKPFTLSAGLEEDSVKMTDEFYCSGSKEFLEDTVKCHNNEGHGMLDTMGALAESCNVALMDMADKIGVRNFTKFQSKFGFGQYTGIDLPNEMSCKSLLYTEENMREIDLATNSFGQNFNLTMIQLSSAFCSIANGGYYYKPYIVKGIYNEEGELVESFDRTLVSRTISENTADKVKRCLRAVVTEGTGDYAQIDGYVIAGKTGTAEKAGREEGNYLVSFIGFAPYDNPEVVCYVVIDEPESGDEHGVSSTLFNMIMTEVLPYLNVTPAEMDKDPALEEETYDRHDEREEETQTADEETDNSAEGSAEYYEEENYEEVYYEEEYSEEPAYEEEYYEEPVYDDGAGEEYDNGEEN